MIQTTLAYEQKRQTGQPPQVGLFVQLLNTTVVFVAAGFPALEGELYLADGSRKADGTITAGTDVLTVYRGLLGVDPVTEGDDAGGDAASPQLTVLPSRRWTTRATIDNATGLLGELLANEPFVGKRAQLRLMYPGLAAADMLTRYAGEIARETVTDGQAVFDLRSA